MFPSNAFVGLVSVPHLRVQPYVFLSFSIVISLTASASTEQP